MQIPLTIGLFVLLALIIALAGYRLVKYAERLAQLTGIGEALFGAILLGAITSMAGIMTSVTAAYQGHPELAMSNAIGGIAAQTLFLALADLLYRKANLEHSSASYANLLVGLLLILMLSFILLVIFAPGMAIGHVHPASVLLLALYYRGNLIINQAKKAPMWLPKRTEETIVDGQGMQASLKAGGWVLWSRFILLALVVGIAGYGVAQTGIRLAEATGLSEGLVGSLFTAVVTSFPELIVTLAAVRRRALTLAVSNIIGGNSFDVLFVSFSDFFYRQGSIYHDIGQEQIYVLVLTLMLTAILLGGLLVRQREGLGKIGWESSLIILLFVGGYVLLYI